MRKTSKSDQDVSMLQTMLRAAAANKRHFQELIEPVINPASTEAEIQSACIAIQKAGGIIWIDQESGKPNFELARLFETAIASLRSRQTPPEERQEIVQNLQRLSAGF